MIIIHITYGVLAGDWFPSITGKWFWRVTGSYHRHGVLAGDRLASVTDMGFWRMTGCLPTYIIHFGFGRVNTPFQYRLNMWFWR